MNPEVAKALDTLKRGGVVAFPTDTVWGLLALPNSARAVAKIYRLKARPEDKPLQLLVAGFDKAREIAEVDERFFALAERYWPGPLTIVAPARRPYPLVGAVEKVGLREPANETLKELIRAAGGVLAATSLNQSGKPPVKSYAEALAFGADYVFPGEVRGDVASSVVDLVTGEVLREGAIPKEELSKYL